MTWYPAEADPETAARIRAEWEQIRAALGDAAPDPDCERGVSITADDAIHFTTATAMFALANTGVAVAYRPHLGGAEEVSHWRDGAKVAHIVIPPPNENN